MKHRFRCPWCNRVFTEPDEDFGLRRRSSQRLRQYLRQEGLHQTVKRVAVKEKAGEGLVRRCVVEEIRQRLVVLELNATPALMGLDEFSVRKGRLFHTAIYNLTDMTVIAAEGQGNQKVEEYLDKLKQPDAMKAVSMDMHGPFRQAVQICLPQAKVVVDKFHLIRYVNDALDKVQSRLQGGKWKEVKSRELFRSRYTLLKSAENLTNRE